MKSKPLHGRKQTSRQIEHLLPHFEHILVTLLDGPTNVNGIFRKLNQTGFTNKKDVTDAIEILRRGELISKKRHPENTIKLIASLTDFGKDVALVILNVNNYIKAWTSLDEAMEKEFNPAELKSALRRTKNPQELRSHWKAVLKYRGWSEEEIESFEYYRYQPSFGLIYLLEQSPAVFINVLLIKYSIFLEMKLNTLAQNLLNNILINSISKVFQTFRVRHQGGNTPSLAFTNKMSQIVLDQINPVILNGGLTYQFINEDVIDVFDSLFSVVGPGKEFARKIATRIKSIRKSADEIEGEYQSPSNNVDIIRVNEHISSRRIIPYLQKLMNRLGS